MLEFEEFIELTKKINIVYGQIVSAERVPKTNNLLHLQVKFSDEDVKSVVTNLGSKFEISDFQWKIFPFVTNLKPAKIRGILSEAMIVLPHLNEEVFLNMPNIGAKLF